MKRTCLYITLLLVGMAFMYAEPALCQDEQEVEWQGKLFDGMVITEKDLKVILDEHRKFIFDPEKYKEKRAILFKADLRGAKLFGADLRKADLSGADLSGASLRRADVSRANLINANLSDAKLSKTMLTDADLSGADLGYANLSEAYLGRATLSRASLFNANLSGAQLREAELSGANLIDANLSGANLINANLSGAKLFRANLSGSIFEPVSLPDIRNIAFAHNLSKMKYTNSRQALTELREGFKNAGLRRQEREVTHAIKLTQRKKLWNDVDNSILNKIESIFYLVFFELTCAYGMAPGRPLILILPLITIFAIPYAVVLKSPPKKDGIWKAWNPDRSRQDLGAEKPYRLENLKFLPAMGLGLYFSILSAFSIGWRELNVGTWISRIQPREYQLRATGWVRTVSGIQSIISVYLIALWVLTFFGRPFEAF